MSHETKAEWAPCVHSKEDAEQVKPWLRKVIETDAFVAKEDPDPTEDCVLERILWIIGTEFSGGGGSWLKDIKFDFGADQWVGVGVDITLKDGSRERLWTQGDTFLLAMAKTLERLRVLASQHNKTKGDTRPGSNGSRVA